MTAVGSPARPASPARRRHEPVVVGAEVVAQLDGEVAVGEVASPRPRGVESGRFVAGEEKPRHEPVATAGEADEVPARLVERGRDQRALEDRELLLAGQVASAHEPREGRVAVDVARDEDEMISRHRSGVELAGPASARLRAAQWIVQPPTAMREPQLVIGARDRHLEADDRANRAQARRARGLGLGLGRGLVEADRGVEAGVIGDRDRRHADHGRPCHELLGVAGAVEEAEVGVRVELAVVVRRLAHRTTDDRTSVLF